MRLSMTESEVIRKETSGFRYYSWWTDLPWYNSDHFGTILRRMGADRNESYVSLLQQLHNQMSGSDWIFEHLVYQYWTLIQYGYQFDFIQCKCTCLENPTSCSTVNEGLHDLLNSTDKLCRQTVLDFVNTRPLWISCAELNLWPAHWEQTFLFSFHHDRWCDRQWHKGPVKYFFFHSFFIPVWWLQTLESWENVRLPAFLGVFLTKSVFRSIGDMQN